jgi:hypothetical protein
MNSREFFTHALLSCHKVLMDAMLPDDLPDDDDDLDEEILPIAEKVSKIASLYATELTIRWEGCLDLYAQVDREDQTKKAPSTRNLTNPPLDIPPSTPDIPSSSN